MGLMSRRVLPVCGRMCFCCPGLRSRSRQPVKRYNMLLSAIYPKSQDEPPNDRKIGKLAEYASKNPMRIPKIASGLEQRGYKEIRVEHWGSVRVVMRAYSKLLASCTDEMSLFAISGLSMIGALLDQTRHDEMRILACQALLDFIRYQTDATYMRNLDAFIPKLCGLACETGGETRRLPLRAAGLQALSAMVGYMADYSHIPEEFSEVVRVTLQNYELPTIGTQVEVNNEGDMHDKWVKEVTKGEGHAHVVSVYKEVMQKLHSQKERVHFKDSTTLSRTEVEKPSVLAQICIQNMARLAKEATTVRRVLDPMFRYFDIGRHWSPERGLALAVLCDMQYLMEKTENDELLLVLLVRHLDHKSVADQLSMKIDIIALTTVLARLSKAKATVAEVGAMSDLSRHLRRSFQFSLEAVGTGEAEVLDHNLSLQSTIEECLMEFGRRVGDASPVLDMMAVALERLPAKEVVARSTVQAVSVLALSVAYLPDHLNVHQEFPEALFNELLQAMLHPDVETRIGAHRILVLLLIPASVSLTSRYEHFLKSRPSAFSSAAALFEKLKRESVIGTHTGDSDEESRNRDGKVQGRAESMGRGNWQLQGRTSSMGRDDLGLGKENSIHSTTSPSHRQALRQSMGRSLTHSRGPSSGAKDTEMSTVRLSGHQAELLLSTLWLQTCMPDNVPLSYEAISHSYSLTLLFSRSQTSDRNTLVRVLQLALSLRSLAIDDNAIQLMPARRRSLFTLATAMLVFAAKTYNIPQIVGPAKAPLTPSVKDPYMELTDESTLTVVSFAVIAKEYGTAADDHVALQSLANISLTGDLSNEALVSRIIEGSPALVESLGAGVKEQMLQRFLPQDSYTLALHLYTDTPHTHGSPHGSQESLSFDEAQLISGSVEDDFISDTSGPDLPRLLRENPVPVLAPQAMGVSQLIEAALETAGQVASVSVSNVPLSYSATASQCEVFGSGTHKKMSIVLKLDSKGSPLLVSLPGKDMPSKVDHDHEGLEGRPSGEERRKHSANGDANSWSISNSPTFKPVWLSPAQGESWQALKLPPSSPYDNFLKAAGC